MPKLYELRDRKKYVYGFINSVLAVPRWLSGFVKRCFGSPKLLLSPGNTVLIFARVEELPITGGAGVPVEFVYEVAIVEQSESLEVEPHDSG